MAYKTVQAKANSSSIIKPEELINVIELVPLKLSDRRIFNLLLANSWHEVTKNKEWSIPKSDLLVHTKATDQLDLSIGRLMGARVKVQITRKEDGEKYTRSFTLLEHIDEPVRKSGLVYYKFPQALRVLIMNSTAFARLQKAVMFQLSSKYSLALYEMIQQRGNLDHKWSEAFTIAQLRGLLGVPDGKLKEYKNFKARCLLPAVQEVDFLSEYRLHFLQHKTGKFVTSITLHWYKKSITELKEAFKEMKASRTGREARMRQEVEKVFS